MLMARNLMSLQDVLDRTGQEWARWSADDVSLIAMPIGHIAGTGWGFWTLFRGAKGIVLRDFDPGHILDLIERDKINKLFLVPSRCRRSLLIRGRVRSITVISNIFPTVPARSRSRFCANASRSSAAASCRCTA
jgi:acyl-CoA synthetase (AMP-forming)/AMP-acid ligase II